MSGRRFDRDIARLAVPSFATLVAEPLYLLADTAVVGHLGTAPLGGLAVASSILLTAHALCIFLAYGTTAAVARLLGAGDEREAAEQAVQGLWLAVLVGLVLAAVGLVASGPLVAAFGATGGVADAGRVYLRISLAGLPFLLLALAGTGYLRGVQDTRTPLVLAVGSSVVNLGLELLFVYGLDRGIGASALATVLVQVAVGLVYVAAVAGPARSLGVGLRPSGRRLRSLLRVGLDLVVRTAALRGSLVAATVVATRIGTVALAAHQVAFEVWNFLAMALDALAIAAQAMVGRLLGAGDADGARAAGRRLVVLGLAGSVLSAAVVLAVRPVLPAVFTDDPAVREVAAFLLLWVAALQPVGAVVFVLDGVLIGAGDQRYLAIAMVVAAAGFGLAVAPVRPLGLGVGWLWAALGVLMAGRAVTLVARFRRGRWAVVGSVA